MITTNALPVADDWDLLNRVADHPRALADLFERHRDFVFRIARSEIHDRDHAEDITQEVFYRIGAQRRRFFKGAQFRTWLYRVTVNLARDHRRRQRYEASNQTWPDVGHVDTNLESDLAYVFKALANLPHRQRQVAVLRLLEGMSTQETAQAMRISLGAVKTHLHRATHQLQKTLKQGDLR